MWDQEAIGSAYACGGGAGVSTVPGYWDDLTKLGASVSFGDEGSFSTNKDVDFEAFHGVRIRYTTASISPGAGYNWSYISFPKLGVNSVPVGGWSLGELSVSANVNIGLLFLHKVPADYIVEQYDMTEWNENTSEWITEHTLPVYFSINSSDITQVAGDITLFAEKVAKDILQK